MASPLAFEDTSQFAPRYSDSAFRSIHSGMTTREVIDRLGEPLHRASGVWFYSRSSCDSDFVGRLVRFEREVVIETHAEFYVD